MDDPGLVVANLHFLTTDLGVVYKAHAWPGLFGIDQKIRPNISAINSASSIGSSGMPFMKLSTQAIFVLRIALSYTMMVWSRMRMVMPSATSMTNFENTIRAYATLRFAGDALDPDEISRVVKEQPTRAYRKGQTYRPGPRSPEVTGKTGVWYFSTKRNVKSKNLADHLNALERLIAPFGDQDNRLRELRDIMERRNLHAHVTCFWRGLPGGHEPSIPSVATTALRRLPADIEPDFATSDLSA